MEYEIWMMMYRDKIRLEKVIERRRVSGWRVDVLGAS